MIHATRKTGFLIEDASMLGKSIIVLRDAARNAETFGLRHELREAADWLDGLRVSTYYEPVPEPVQIEEVLL